VTQSAYAVARVVAPSVAEHLRRHLATLGGVPEHLDLPDVGLLPDARVIEAMVDAAFWASVRREEGYIPKISLAFLPPMAEVRPLIFGRPLALEPSALTRLAAAVERPGIHLGVWPVSRPSSPPGARSELEVWGTTHSIPPFCFVVEVVAPGLLVLKHRPRQESHKFVNVAVLEGDRAKIVDESASMMADCPALLTSMLGFDAALLDDDALNILVQLALSMRRHGRGGILLVIPARSDAWRESTVQPVAYPVEPPFAELTDLLAAQDAMPENEWTDEVMRAVDAIAGLTGVDGATIITERYEVVAFGAKIGRRDGGRQVDQIVVTEPVEGGAPARMNPGQLGGTRHLAAAQFVQDQPGALALVASQDGRFTIFAWSPCEETVHAHRVEVLLL
jgi:hypothetical protein